MAKENKNKFEEFHDGEHEFCHDSGPLKSRKIKAPSAIIKSLITSVATAATVYAAVFMPLFSFVPSLQHVEGNVATVEVKMENVPEDSIITYTVSLKNRDDIPVDSGEVDAENNIIVLDELNYNEEYIVTFTLHQEGEEEVLHILEFVSGNNDQPIVPHSTSIPTFKPTAEPTVEPSQTPTTKPTIEPTQAPSPTPTIEPTPSLVPESTVEPTPKPEVSVEPDEPVVDIQVKEVTVNRSEMYFDYNQAKAYRIEQTHVFENVPSDEYTIQITQNGEVEEYENIYDEQAQTATITYMGNPILLGETSKGKVVLTYGQSSIISTNEVTTPKLTNLTLDIGNNQDGTYTYRVSGQAIEPSVGQVTINVVLYTDYNGISNNPETLSFTTDMTTFLKDYTIAVDAPGKTLTAHAYAELVWSLDSMGSPHKIDTQTEYRVDEVSEVLFTDIHEVSGEYGYTVNAEFANLAGATPQSMKFYRQSYDPVFNEFEDEELIATLDANQISLNASGNLAGQYTVTEEQTVRREYNGHAWRVVLTYLDQSNTVQTKELNGNIEPFSPIYNHLNSIMWQEDDITYADYELVFSICPSYSPKGADLMRYDAYNWNVLSAEFELTDTHGYIRGQMTSTAQYEMSFNAYLDWHGTEATEYIYNGCGGADYLESSLTNQNGMMNNDGNGYEFISEEFTLFNGARLISEYTETYVLVTLADGAQIKVTQSQPDSSGTVSVNWNDNNNIVVTVNQNNVAFDQQTVVDFVQEIVRTEELMLGLVNTYTYRCFNNYQ